MSLASPLPNTHVAVQEQLNLLSHRHKAVKLTNTDQQVTDHFYFHATLFEKLKHMYPSLMKRITPTLPDTVEQIS